MDNHVPGSDTARVSNSFYDNIILTHTSINPAESLRGKLKADKLSYVILIRVVSVTQGYSIMY